MCIYVWMLSAGSRADYLPTYTAIGLCPACQHVYTVQDAKTPGAILVLKGLNMDYCGHSCMYPTDTILVLKRLNRDNNSPLCCYSRNPGSILVWMGMDMIVICACKYVQFSPHLHVFEKYAFLLSTQVDRFTKRLLTNENAILLI